MFAVTVIGQAPAPARTSEVFSLDSTKKGIWHLPEETPIAFVYNRQNYAVMLASPTDMVDFALGFSLSERVINTAQDIQNLEIQYSEKGVELFFKISPKRFQRLQLKTRRRNLAGSAGCGICGLQSTDILFDKLLPIDGPPMAIDKTALQIAMQGFAALQPLHQSTKSVHGAAWVNTNGSIQLVREDVGRHNALDKLIGAMRRANIPPASGFLLISSRCSFEIIDKAARAKIPAILSLSAPTNLALQKASQANISLYARDKIGWVKRMGKPAGKNSG